MASRQTAPGGLKNRAARSQQGVARPRQLASDELVGREPAQSALPAAGVPRWVPVTTTVIAALAFADSAYLTYTHYTGTAPAGCSLNPKSLVNCGLVTTSVYSHPFGVPVAVAGLCWSAVMLALCTPWGWRIASRWVSWARLAGSIAGVGMVCYLLLAEFKWLHHICEYCTGVHILTLALFVVVAFGTALSVPTAAGYDEPGATEIIE